MADGMAGRTVIVTGAARGIGAGIAALLAERGARVVLADRDGAAAEAEAARLAALGGMAEALAIDLADEASIVEGCARVAARYGTSWGLVNNAGVQDRQLLLDATADAWDEMLAVNTRGPFLMMREVGRRMRAGGAGGRIVTVGSAAAIGCLTLGHAAYAASKAALLGLTRAAALELAPHRVTVNLVLPGGVVTPGAVTAQGPPAEGPGRRPPPLGRCEPGDIAAAVAFLLSPAAGRITNQALAVDAGWSVT